MTFTQAVFRSAVVYMYIMYSSPLTSGWDKRVFVGVLLVTCLVCVGVRVILFIAQEDPMTALVFWDV